MVELIRKVLLTGFVVLFAAGTRAIKSVCAPHCGHQAVALMKRVRVVVVVVVVAHCSQAHQPKSCVQCWSASVPSLSRKACNPSSLTVTTRLPFLPSTLPDPASCALLGEHLIALASLLAPPPPPSVCRYQLLLTLLCALVSASGVAERDGYAGQIGPVLLAATVVSMLIMVASVFFSGGVKRWHKARVKHAHVQPFTTDAVRRLQAQGICSTSRRDKRGCTRAAKHHGRRWCGAP